MPSDKIRSVAWGLAVLVGMAVVWALIMWLSGFEVRLLVDNG